MKVKVFNKNSPHTHHPSSPLILLWKQEVVKPNEFVVKQNRQTYVTVKSHSSLTFRNSKWLWSLRVPNDGSTQSPSDHSLNKQRTKKGSEEFSTIWKSMLLFLSWVEQINWRGFKKTFDRTGNSLFVKVMIHVRRSPVREKCQLTTKTKSQVKRRRE